MAQNKKVNLDPRAAGLYRDLMLLVEEHPEAVPDVIAGLCNGVTNFQRRLLVAKAALRKSRLLVHNLAHQQAPLRYWN